jgi:hypothetical protein
MTSVLGTGGILDTPNVQNACGYWAAKSTSTLTKLS